MAAAVPLAASQPLLCLLLSLSQSVEYQALQSLGGRTLRVAIRLAGRFSEGISDALRLFQVCNKYFCSPESCWQA